MLQDYNLPLSWTKLQVKPEHLHFKLHIDERTLLKCEAYVTTPLSVTTRLTLKVGGSTNALQSVHLWPMLINLVRRFLRVTNLEREWTIPCTEEYFLDRNRHDCKGESVRRTRDGMGKYIRDHAGKADLESDVRVHLQWGKMLCECGR